MTLIKRFNSEFPNYFEGFFGKDSSDHFWFPKPGNTIPSVNILESPEGFEIEIAAPGLEKADFKVNLQNNLLTISSSKSTQDEENAKKYTKKEFSYASFERVFTLPNSVDGEKIEANYSNGILKVSVPKKDEAKVKTPKTIEIK
jgi:HSP20 family protein